MFSIVLILCFVIAVLLLVSYIHLVCSCLRKAKVVVGSTKNGKTVVKFTQAPGPLPWPIIGNLALLANYVFPFQGFTELAKEYGDAYTLTLGTTRCLIVNNLELIREVLNQNGKFFGGRPNFIRYHKLFGGNRNNSLALCDWSLLQQKRRNLARRHCSPRSASSYYSKMSNVGCFETKELMDRFEEKIVFGVPFDIKQLIQQACANMFCQYMCSIRFEYDDSDFKKIVEYFDEIFWEINQGYAIDFLPWLLPFYKKHISKIKNWSATIRKFILERIISDREQNFDLDEPENDFTDALLKSLIEDKNVSRETIIFMLEDFIGGHSAVGNLIMLALIYVAKYPHIGKRIQKEADNISQYGKRKINLYDIESMPYTLATIFEVLRYSSSPIVPHVATEDTVISDYGVTSGTIVFINNYKLNTSEQYWSKPEIFDPERFLEKTFTTKKYANMEKREQKHHIYDGSDSGVEFEKDPFITISHSDSPLMKSKNNFIKASSYKIQIKRNLAHFLPFSIGKRTCIGQNLVRGFGFIILANILQRYNVSSNDMSSIKLKPACVALPAKTFPLILTQRKPIY